MKFHVNLKFKDLIFVLLIFLFFFLFKQNIFALSSEFDTSYHGSIKLDDYYSFYSSNQNIINNDNALKQWFNSQSEFTAYYHFISPHSFSNLNNYDERYLFVKNNDYQYVFIRPYLYDSYYNTYSTPIRDSSFSINYSYSYCYNISFNNCTLTNTTSSGNLISPYNYSNSTNSLLLLFSSSHDLPINRFGSLSNAYMFELNNSYYGIDDILPSITDFSTPSLILSNLTPISDNLDNFYKYNVTLDYSVFDTSKYLYQWKNPSSDDWIDVLYNNLTLDLEYNGNYFFRILDKSDNSIIFTSSLTITDISISTPYIINKISTPDSCHVKYNNEDLTICKKLYLEPSIYGSNYHYQYSLDNGSTWEYLFSSYSFLVQKGDIVPLRVIDSDNNVLWSDTLSFNEIIDILPNDLGLIVSFDDTYEGSEGNKKFFTKIYFYNLDMSYFHNVYISYDGFNWSLLSLSNYTLYMYSQSDYYSSNNTFYIKILDSNNDVIFTTSHSVKLNSDNNDIVGYLQNFNRSMQGPISSVINAPLRFINMLNTGDMCQPINLPFAHIGNIGIPCIRQVMQTNVPDFLNIYQIITTGLIAYFCSLSLIKTIKTLVRPDDDRIEVVDL